MKKIALIPAYEPNEKLIQLVETLNNNNFIIIVVNDGSDKKYDEIFDSLKKKVTILKHKVNRGKGSALKTGLSYIKKNYKKYIVVTIDADGQHSVKDANRLWEEVKNYPDSLVLGKRIRSKKTPLRSRLGNDITRYVYYKTTGINVYDTQTGLRAFNEKLVGFMLKVKGERFEYEINVLLECVREGIPIREIEIETIYFENNSTSHFNTLKDSFRIYKEILKFSCSSSISFVMDYTIYTIFFFCIGSITISNILARICSSIFNYNLNRSLVFNSKDNFYHSAFKYFTLAIFILIGNTIVLNILSNILNIYPLLAKIITECLFFIISFIVQKLFIFRRNDNEEL